jgi:putative SOS response-associated peptidase YedK
MCGRYSEVTIAEKIEKHFSAKFAEPNLFLPNPNISIGDFAPVITGDQPHTIQLLQFGLNPHWAKKRMYLFNARSEGDHNTENNPAYTGAKGIIAKPAFRSSIRTRRCLVLADGFIEGTTAEGLSKPYIIFLKERKPFAMAGIWDEWTDKETGEIVRSFAIITTTANELLQKIPHHRSPVIIDKNDYHKWLQEEHLASVTKLLHPIKGELLGAYPISPAIKNPKNKGIELLKPIGEMLTYEVPKEVYEVPARSNRKRGGEFDPNDTIENRMKK